MVHVWLPLQLYKKKSLLDSSQKCILWKKIDGKECNTAKSVSVATGFNEFKDVLPNKKIMRHKIKRIQNKRHKIGTYEVEVFIML